MEFTSVVSIFDNNLWSYHIPVPLPIAQQFIENAQDRRVVCVLNGAHTIHAAIMSKGEQGHYLMLNKALRKKMNLEAGSEIHVQIEKDESKYGMPMPEEMQEALYMDPEADKHFHALTPGKQRSLIYIVHKIKSSNKRIQKAIVILEHLKQHDGQIDYKQLNQDFKDANREIL